MYTILNINSWKRKEHFEFFKAFDQPYFGMETKVDISKAYQICKANNWSLFLYYHFLSQKAVNQTEAFRYRLIQDEVRLYEHLHVNTNMFRADKTFTFSFIPFDGDWPAFEAAGKKVMALVERTTGLGLNADTDRPDSIHYSTIPWVDFTGLTHARNSKYIDSVPKISFGKITQVDGKHLMPISVHCHHALVDGYDVGMYFQRFHELLGN